MRHLFILLILFGCIAVTSAQKTVLYPGMTFHYQLVIDSAVSADSANFDCSVRSIAILSPWGEIIQTIRPPENHCFCDLPADQLFIVQDVNFDGIEDIQLLRFLPAAPNLPYYFWTYSRVMHKFTRQRSLEGITSPDFDFVHRRITSFWRSGCCDHGLNVYRWIKGRPVLVEASEVKRDPDDDTKLTTTVKKRIGGEMKLVKRTVEVDKGASQ